MARPFVVAALLVSLGLCGAVAATPHPLDPLTAEELIRLRDILAESGQFSADTNFAWIQLAEPQKSEVTRFTPGAGFVRAAALDAIDYAKGKTFHVVVDLNAGRIASLTDLGDRQPGINSRDIGKARAIINADPRIQQALIARGLSVPGQPSDAVYLAYMPIGRDPGLEQTRSRMIRVLFASDQNAVDDSSPPVDGLMAIVDLYAGRVVKLVDTPGAASKQIPHDVFAPSRLDKPSARPVVPADPDSRNFSIDGPVVEWRNWRFRYSFNLREGLVLYQIGYDDGSRLRPVLYRAAVSEVLTSYGDPGELWSWMQIFDEGSLGLGYLAVAAEPGREVPLNAVTISPVVPDPTTPRFSDIAHDRIYLYERDGGNLFYHQDGTHIVHARATELVVGFLATLGNYTYGFNWVFKEDGSFRFEVELAGQIVTKFVRTPTCEGCAALAAGPGADGKMQTYIASGSDGPGAMVYPNLVGLTHQHWFNLRLDFDVDGTENAVMENNIIRPGSHANGKPAPAAAMAHTVFGVASEARRHMNEASARTWTIYNPHIHDQTGRAPGYTVTPMENTEEMFGSAGHDDASGFIAHHLWVTPYRDGDLYAAGRYPNQAGPKSPDALASRADDGSIYDKDIVVWYSLGTTHVPRPEDFPLMSNMKLSVAFRPDGFFTANPMFRGLPQ